MKHTDNAAFDRCSKSDFHIIFPLIEPPKTEILYVYTECLHIQNHGVVE